MVRVAGLVLTLLVATAGAHATPDDRIAHRLFAEGRHAEAAELFTSPAWKGVAFYRSDQYWRAVEAFLRAGDPASTYNLGNAYARLGYFELALQAFLGALSADPSNADAAANADLMRSLIAARERSGAAGVQPQAEAIDRIESRREEERGAAGDGETGQADKRESEGNREDARESEAEPEASGNQSAGDGGDGADPGTPEGDAESGEAEGEPGADETEATASASARAGGEADSGKASGLRARIEADQATEQWLNRIVDDPGRFLKARIAQEARRRAAAGTAVRSETDAW
jgi:Ca-activated chloride channel homolog